MRKGSGLAGLVFVLGLSVAGLIALRELTLRGAKAYKEGAEAEWQRAISFQEAGVDLRKVSRYEIVRDVSGDGVNDYLVTEEGKEPRIVHGYNPQSK